MGVSGLGSQNLTSTCTNQRNWIGGSLDNLQKAANSMCYVAVHGAWLDTVSSQQFLTLILFYLGPCSSSAVCCIMVAVGFCQGPLPLLLQPFTLASLLRTYCSYLLLQRA